MKFHPISLAVLITLFCACDRACAVEYEENGADPFNRQSETTPPSSSSTKPSDAAQMNVPFTIQGLVWNAKNPQVIINGKVLKVGDTLGNAEVLAITREGVKIRQEGREVFLDKKGREENEKKL